MARRPRLGKKLFKSLLPILLLVVLALGGIFGWIVYDISRPHVQPYLVTPQAFAQISGPGIKATDETWRNQDGTMARGWLLRGAEGAPAVVLLHRLGTDRSWLFNLGVKLNETTNFTILWPDLRGHGLKPSVKTTSFGAREADDLLAALDYLKRLKSPKGELLVGDPMGAYGIELGAYASLKATNKDARIRVLVLDSIPRNPDELVNAAVKEETGMGNTAVQALAHVATRVYFLGRYDNSSSCALASSLTSQHVLLVSGADAGYLRESTVGLAKCFPNAANLEVKTDLPLTGFSLPSATGEQGEGYDRRVIEFFDKSLRPKP
ncbi:MAG: Alpha/beta hydrolase family [Acidobacteria bacterium]|nr:Alpha/beta hydrolase family [Acidobacteriota bacterium]